MSIRTRGHNRRVHQSDVGSALVSAALHATTVTVWFVATLHRPELQREHEHSQLFYLTAADRAPAAQAGSAPAARHVIQPVERNEGAAEPLQSKEEKPPLPVGQTRDVNATGQDNATTIAAPRLASEDSVYPVLDVDSAVTRSATSAAPAYPFELVAKNVQGFVVARYVVDTAGMADTSTFVVLESTDPAFTLSVRDALPRMRFGAAKVGSQKVRQLVQQQFTFKLNAESRFHFTWTAIARP